MRILFLSQLVPYPADAGPKVRSYHVLQYLASAGHAITLVAFERASDRPESIEHLKQFCEAVYTMPMVRSRVRDAWYLGQSLLCNQPFLIARDSVAAMHHTIQQLVNQQHFDAIHTDQLWMAQYALRAQAQRNGHGSQTRLILDQHNAVYLIPQRLAATSKNPLKRLILAREAQTMKQYEEETCRQFDQVVWVTDEDKKALGFDHVSYIGDLTIPICVDTSDKPPIQRQAHARRVTFLGGLHWPPNADGVVWFANEVWPRVLAQAPDALLTVIGKNPPRALQAQDNPIPNLVVTGYVEKVEPYLVETSVFIVPLHAGGGMRVKIIDAWSWGLPVVSTSVGAEGIAYRDGDNLLVGDEADTFADAVIRILSDPAIGHQLALSGRNTVETEYDWRITYEAWDKVYPPIN